MLNDKAFSSCGNSHYKNITPTPLGNTEQKTHETIILKNSVGDVFRLGAAESINTPLFDRMF